MSIEAEKLMRRFNQDLGEPGFSVRSHKYKLMHPDYSFPRDYTRAIDGNSDAFFRLVQFDTSFLAEKWAVELIREKQEAGNTEFFKQLGKAVQSPKRWSKKRLRSGWIEAIFNGLLKDDPAFFKKRGNIEKVRKALYAECHRGVPEDDPIWNVITDNRDFNKFLRRHRLLG